MTQDQITRTNCIICGNCQNQLIRIPNDSITLIYLDPPFFSSKYHDIIWNDDTERRQFEDTKLYTLICECGKVFPEDNKFCSYCGADKDKAKERRSNDIEIYLRWLRPKLERCRDVLKPTGSIYCHLDRRVVHYVKVIMDEIFGYNNFQNEIIWSYKSGGASKHSFAKKHDTILFYSKSNKKIFNSQYDTRDESELVNYPHIDERGHFQWWAGPGSKAGGKDGKKIYFEPGTIMRDVWEIPIINQMAKERVGPSTQKPEVILERIIRASSNPGDIIIDPFCGCGTAVSVAQKLGRRWIGIDVSPTSCKLMVKRLRDINDDWVQITEADIIDLPRTCKELSDMDPFEFQFLVISKLDGKQNPKKVGDHGIDGWTYKTDEYGHKQIGLDAAVQVKQSGKKGKIHKVGTPTIDRLVGAMAGDPDIDGKHGIVVGFDFSTDVKKQVKNLKAEAGITIDLITVKELFDCE